MALVRVYIMLVKISFNVLKSLFKIKEEIISQIILNELSKHTLRINSGLLETHFSYTL